MDFGGEVHNNTAWWPLNGSIAGEPAPSFATEAEERAFRESHDSAEYLDWRNASKAVLPGLKPTTQTLSLRPPLHLLENIKTAANARDLPCQSLIKLRLQ
jgi:predicted DNA binding CopG/RHH family protein